MKKIVLYLMSFGLAVSSMVNGAEKRNLENSVIENDAMIKRTLQEANKDFFLSHSMRLDFLKNHPKALPTLAKWLYEEWRTYDSTLSFRGVIDAFKARLNTGRLPLSFVVLKNDKPVGTVSLKGRPDDDFSDFPENSIWLESLYIVSGEKGQGLDDRLLEFASTIAENFGYDKLYLYISNPNNEDWYLERGAEHVADRPFHGQAITIMYIPLDN